MIAAAICILSLIAPNQPPSNNDPALRGSQESQQYYPSDGLTLEKLRGLPRFRETWYPPQPQAWAYPTIWVYSTNSYNLGGYRPPRASGYYNPGGTWLIR